MGKHILHSDDFDGEVVNTLLASDSDINIKLYMVTEIVHHHLGVKTRFQVIQGRDIICTEIYVSDAIIIYNKCE